MMDVERGTGMNVRVELSPAAHEQLKLEALRRKRQGLQPYTLEGILRELVEKARRDWPSLVGEEEGEE